jgi:Spy/CpxP family protein refolding chaperone
MKKYVLALSLFALSSFVFGQAPGDAPQERHPMPPMAAHPGGCEMPPGPQGMGMPMMKWWKNPHMAKELGLSDQQIQQMDNAFNQNRNQLIDLHAELEKAEGAMEPLIGSDTPNEGQVLAQIDRVAQARANLEKAHARVMLALRNALTLDQWKKLQNLHNMPPPPQPAGMMMHREGGPEAE